MKKFALLLSLMLVASACSAGTSSDTTTSTASGAASAGSGSPTTTAAPTTTVSVPSTSTMPPTTVAAEEPSDIEPCFVGEWELDSEKFFRDVIAMAPAGGIPGDIEVRTGAYVMVISGDGTFTSERQAWSFAVILPEGEAQVTITAAQSGTYSLEGDSLSTVLLPGEPPEVEMFLDGKPIPNIPQMQFSATESDTATMTCEGDVLTATADGFATVWYRIG